MLESPSLKHQQIPCLVSGHFLSLLINSCLLVLLCPQMEEAAKEQSEVSLLRAVIPFMRTLCLWLITSQRLHLLIPSHCKLGFHHVDLGGHKPSVDNRSLSYLLSPASVIFPICTSPSPPPAFSWQLSTSPSVFQWHLAFLNDIDFILYLIFFLNMYTHPSL